MAGKRELGVGGYGGKWWSVGQRLININLGILPFLPQSPLVSLYLFITLMEWHTPLAVYHRLSLPVVFGSKSDPICAAI